MTNKYYCKTKEGKWVHRHPLKVIINPILRLIQFWMDDPYVIVSQTKVNNDMPNFIKFKFCRVQYRNFNDE